jgi:hypothetical protein
VQVKSFWDQLLASPLSPWRFLLFLMALPMTGFWISTASHDYGWIRTTGHVVSVDLLCRYKRRDGRRNRASYSYREVVCADASEIRRLSDQGYFFDRPASYPHVRFSLSPEREVIVRTAHHVDPVNVGDNLTIAHPAGQASSIWVAGYLRGYDVWLWLCAMFLHLTWLPYEIIWRRVRGLPARHFEAASSYESGVGRKYEIAPWPHQAVIALTFIGCMIYIFV